jgi:TonB family protein
VVSNLAAEVNMPRRPSVLLLSIVVHALVLIVLASADLWRPITEWPTPRAALAFLDDTPRVVRLDDVPLPPQPRRVTTPSVPADGPLRQTEEAPAVAPSHLTPESEHQGVSSLSFGDPTPIDSLFGGRGNGVAPPPPPAPAPSPEPKPIRLHSGIKPPQRLVNVAPVYPTMALAVRKEGIVIIDATIDEQGNVTDTKILRSIPLLDEAALAAVRQWKFSPTLLNGLPVPIVMTVTVNFKLTP